MNAPLSIPASQLKRLRRLARLACRTPDELLPFVLKDGLDYTEWLVEQVLSAMVKAGHLDKPGIGFVFVVPVDRAVGFVEAQEMAAYVRRYARQVAASLRVQIEFGFLNGEYEVGPRGLLCLGLRILSGLIGLVCWLRLRPCHGQVLKYG